MTTILERIVETFGPATPEAIAAKIDAVRDTLPDLERAVGDEAYQAEQGIEGAEARLTVARAALSEARAQLETLGMAHTRAVAARDVVSAAQRDKLRQSQHAAMKRQLELRNAAGEKLAEALAAAVDHWRQMVAHNDEMKRALPVDEKLPMGHGSSLAELKRYVASELWRVGGTLAETGWAPNDPPSFPLAEPTDPKAVHAPDRERGLTRALQETGEYLLGSVINSKREAV